MKMVNRLTAILSSLVLLHASTLQAHTELSSIVPADGAVINQPLSALELSFTTDVRLLRLALMHAGQHSVDIGFKPTADTKRQFSVPFTNLQEGPYELQWTIIGADGHTMEGSSDFTLTSSATSAQGEDKPDLDHSAHGHAH
jgi:methionine-rich copper-binding protein CopC